MVHSYRDEKTIANGKMDCGTVRHSKRDATAAASHRVTTLQPATTASKDVLVSVCLGDTVGE